MAYQRQDRSPLSPVTITEQNAPSSLEAAYSAMADELARSPEGWKAWKLGGTNHGSRAAFNVDKLYFGAIHQTEILQTPSIAPGFDLFELKGEVEIALRVDASGRNFDAWAVALEMPSSPITNLPGAGVAALVADRCATGALLLGPAHPADTLGSVADVTYAIEVDGEVIAGGTWAQDLVAPPQDCFVDFLALAKDLGFTVKPGDWVATGGITPCKPIPEGARTRILAGGNAVLDFVMTRSGAPER